MVEQNSLFTHVLAQTKQNVQLLITHGQISRVDGEEILSKLAVVEARQSEDSSVASLTQRTQRLNMSPAPHRVQARAIWPWTSEDPNDLSFAEGEIIEIVTETNADWWTGRNRSGKRGLFPSNYVEKLSAQRLSPEPRPAARLNGPGEQRYAPPAPPHAPPQPYPPAPQAYYPPAGPPPAAVGYSYAPPPPGPPAQPEPQQAPEKKSRFGGLGQMMAQSAAGGLGFGAGAAVGSDLVNAIF